MNPIVDSSTQTDSLNQDVQKLAPPTLKSLCIQTEPCDLEKYRIDESEPVSSTKSDDESKQEGEEEDAFDQEYELQRRLNPKTPEDFDQLQSELIMWKFRQQRKIAMTTRNPQQRTKRLLDEETKLIRKIETLKSAASETWKMEKLEMIMDKMTLSKETVDVDTPEITKARDMKSAFADLKKYDNTGERIEVLKQARTLIEKSNDHSALAKDVCSLLDRELEMLGATELDSEYLVGLRKRLLNSFAKLIVARDNTVSKSIKPKFKVNTIEKKA